ncbi:hypothetical protein O3M35_000807 [Rhynocoris fuscipes]|uniref:Uncharacterized protein n=1 Tax=Rhynocoris fuscipes TaxID=488301 RepID=A0AAW1DQ90_9HEMI
MYNKIKGGIKLFGNVVSLGADVAQNAAKNATYISKEAIKETQIVSKQILHSGSDLALKGLDIFENAGENVPLVKYPLQTAIMVSRIIIILGNNVGTKTIDAGARIGGNTADYIDKISRLTINSMKDFTITGCKITTDTVENNMKVFDSTYGLSQGPGATLGSGTTPTQGPRTTFRKGSGANPSQRP